MSQVEMFWEERVRETNVQIRGTRGIFTDIALKCDECNGVIVGRFGIVFSKSMA